jgi:hypothetical protein
MVNFILILDFSLIVMDPLAFLPTITMTMMTTTMTRDQSIYAVCPSDLSHRYYVHVRECFPSVLGVRVPMIMGLYLVCVGQRRRHPRIGRVGEKGEGRMVETTPLVVIVMVMMTTMIMRTKTTKNVDEDDDEVALFLHENGVGHVMQDVVRCEVDRPKVMMRMRMIHPVNEMWIR